MGSLTGTRRLRLGANDAVARRLIQMIRSGDVPALRTLLAGRPELASARLDDGKGGSRTPLHVAADWPGHIPNGVDVVATLVEFGADPNALCEGRHDENPAHLAACCDDVEVLEALIDAGADLGARGGSIAGGTPLDNAIGYGCWQAAHRLVERGARVDKLWHAAALGLTCRMRELCAGPPPPTVDRLSEALWHACRGGQPRSAQYLVALGARFGWIPPYDSRSAVEVAGAPDTRRRLLLDWLRTNGFGHQASR